MILNWNICGFREREKLNCYLGYKRGYLVSMLDWKIEKNEIINEENRLRCNDLVNYFYLM